jgi:hypothetical protein
MSLATAQPVAGAENDRGVALLVELFAEVGVQHKLGQHFADRQRTLFACLFGQGLARRRVDG